MRKLYLTGIALFFVLSLKAQKYDINGTVADSLAKPVAFASMVLANPSDSSTVAFAISNEKGIFNIKGVDQGNYLIIAASMGFDVMYKPISVNRDVKGFSVTLSRTTKSFKEILIRATKVPVMFNGDTVVYNSSSFKTQNNASIEDLIRKMPGIRVNKDGTVTAEGQNVTKVLVNGKEFFGGNVAAATKNLDADIVEKIEVIDRKTDEAEFTGEDDQEREKVINVVLKEENLKGFFGRIRGGYGTGDYYDLNGNLNFFKDETQLSIIGGFNNLNQQLYGWQGMSTLNSLDINPFNQGRNTWWWGGGVKTYEGVGANLHFEPVKGMRTDIAYVVTNESAYKTSQTNAEVFLSESSIFSENTELAESDKQNHQVNAKMEYEPDTLNRIVYRGQFASDIGTGYQLNRRFNFLNAESIVNSGVQREDMDDDKLKIINKIHWTKKNRKNTDNHFLGSVYYGYTDFANNVSNYANSVDSILLPFPELEAPLLNMNLRTQEKTTAITTAYQFRASKKWTLRPGFNVLQSQYNHEFDWIPNDGNILASNSPTGDVTAYNMEYFMRIRYRLDSFTTINVVPEFNQSIEDRSFTTDSLYNYDFNQVFFIPFMFIRSNKPHKYNFNFNIRANVNRPEINQVLPVIDNSNPYIIKKGNIELQNFINYRNNFNYRRILGLGKSIGLSGWNSLSLNPVVSKRTVTEDNYSTVEAINYKNRIYSNYNLEFVWPLRAIKAQIGLDFDYGYNHGYSIQNDKEIKSINHTPAFGPNIQFNEFDVWSLELDYMINRRTGSIGGVENNAFVYHEFDVEFVLTPIERLEWASTLYMEVFGGNTAVGATTIPVLTSELSMFIDKNQQWSLGVRAYDIFNKNQNLWRWWGENSFTQSQSNVVQRYVMGTLTYKIKKKSGSSPGGGPVDRRRH